METLEVIRTILCFDGDIPIDRESGNQCDLLVKESNKRMYYVGVTIKDISIECYVVVDDIGRCSFCDLSSEIIVIEDEEVQTYQFRDIEDGFECWNRMYDIEKGKGYIREDAIESYMKLLRRTYE